MHSSLEKVKTRHICPAIPRHTRGLDAWLKPAGILYLLGKSHLSRKLMLEI